MDVSKNWNPGNAIGESTHESDLVSYKQYNQAAWAKICSEWEIFTRSVNKKLFVLAGGDASGMHFFSSTSAWKEAGFGG